MKLILSLFSFVCPLSGLYATVIPIKSVEEYTKYVTSEKPMVTIYSAEWCGPCQQTKPHFYAASEAYPDITFCLIDTDAPALTSLISEIRSIPMTIFTHKGKKIKQEQGGLTRHQLDSLLKRFRKTVKTVSVKSKPTKSTQPAQKPVIKPKTLTKK